MQVATLQLFLRSLVPALAAGEAHTSARLLDAACTTLEPFRTLGLAEFAAFLTRAEEYQRTGTVRVPDLEVESLLAALARLNGPDVAAGQQDVANALDGLGRNAGLKGTLKPDPKWAEARATQARVAPLIKAIRDLASRITSPDLYADEVIRSEIVRLEALLDVDSLKAVGAEFGVTASARSAASKVLADVLAKLSGKKPPKATRAGKAADVIVDPSVIKQRVDSLRQLVELSADPDVVPFESVEDELNLLKALPKTALFEVVTHAGVDGVKAKDSVKAILLHVRNRLTAARRARDRAEV